ncbi:MAG: uracil-DNA glycosylase family protein [Pseudomonadales bacterium]|nr:uracil-DNA glycosylase family protein [Pseudomonadales bacterium]
MQSPDDIPLATLLGEIRRCTLCAAELPLGPRPVLQAGREARILVVGQAPGTRVHSTGLPFNDPSGDRLREWLGVDRDTFYDPARIAVVPMAFCYPGRGTSGDLPPPPRCAQTWRSRLLAQLPHIQLTVVLGQYAVAWHLPDARGSLTGIVQDWRAHLPALVPMPHPSPRNNLWLRRNPWFETEVVPWVRSRVAELLERD